MRQIAEGPESATAPAQKGDHAHALVSPRHRRLDQIGRLPAGTEKQEDIPWPAERLHRTRKYILEPKVVAHTSEVRGLGEGHHGVGAAVLAEAAGPFLGKVHGIRQAAPIPGNKDFMAGLQALGKGLGDGREFLQSSRIGPPRLQERFRIRQGLRKVPFHAFGFTSYGRGGAVRSRPHLMFRWLGFLFVGLCGVANAQELLPTPQEMTRTRQIAPVHMRLNVKSTDFPVQTQAFRQDWLVQSAAGAPHLTLMKDPTLPEEGYRIEFGGTIEVRASTPTGAAWGLQTLGQLLASGTNTAVVTDTPDTPFRCVMIDVARRYHSISTLKRLVRWAALAKVRFVQLHLTDDQNWMLPSSVLPGIDKLNTHQRPAYTRAEMEELQAFATARGVTIIPEVEFPGHAAILCKYDPAKYRLVGSASENCINFGSEAVRQTCRDILAETAAIFKDSPSIHFGGDEAWYPDADKDPQFRATMDRLGPGADANRVFIDFVGDMAQEVVKQGKTPLVWEGFPRSDFAKQRIPAETVVIAWENHYYPATQLVEDGFKVINAGWDPYYVVNHYPWDAYTLVPLARLYNHDPDVFGIVAWNDPALSAAKIGPGLYGSLMPWWEGHEWNTLAVMPERILAFGCRLWNRNGESGYLGFRRRARHWLGAVARASQPFGLVIEGTRAENSEQFTTAARLSARPQAGLQFGFRTDTRVPTAADFQESVTLDQSGVVTVQAFRDGAPVGEAAFVRLNKVTEVPNLARGAKAWSSAPTDPQFAADLVTDGVADDIGSFWMCYPLPADLTVDLGRAVEARRVEIVAFYAAGSALQYRVQVSADGLTWEEVADASANTTGAKAEGYVHRFSPRPVRYVRVQALRSLQHPSTMPRIHEIRLFND